jgi:phosphatidylserine/phosphatidylglycerophosphate/cardiolipin synthase-like enzyme
MAKRSTSKSSKSKSSKTSPLLSLIIVIGIIIAVVVFGVDPADLGLTTEDSATLVPSNNNGAVVSEEAPGGSGDWYEVYFTQSINSDEPEDHTGSALEQGLIRLIDGAQVSIDAALFELNAPDTTAALIRAAERGVKIRIVADDEHNYDDPTSTIEEVIAVGAEAISDERSAFMHNKFFIIDGQTVWTGSTNVTRNDIYNNNNNAMIIRSPALAANYTSEFEEKYLQGQFTRTSDRSPIPNPVLEISGTRVENFFSPEDGDAIEARLVELIMNAKSSIRVMAFSFTLEGVGNALLVQHQAGIDVQGVVENTGSLRGQMPLLACAGAPFRQDGNPNILHSKVFIIDEEIVVMGSFNFSANARDSNSENVLVIHNKEIAALYLQEWARVFEIGSVPTAEELEC